MIHSCVEVVVREMQRQCRTLRVSAASIADDISLLNWVHHFAIQFLKKNESKMEKDDGAIWRRKRLIIREAHDSRNLRGSS